MTRELLATSGYRRERIPGSRIPEIPGLIIRLQHRLILSPKRRDLRETLINTARELSYKLSVGRTCKRRESDEGMTLFHPPRERFS